jgi:hypothetical protein
MRLDKSNKNHKPISEPLRTSGGHLSIGRGGYTLYFSGSARLQGHDCDEMKRDCVARGLPIIDSRKVPFNAVWDLAVHGPIVAVGRAPDVAPCGAFSNAPLHAVAAAYRGAGAEVFNLPEKPIGELGLSRPESPDMAKDR